MKESSSERKKASLYAWAYRAGLDTYKKLKSMYGEESAKKKMEHFLLNLRSELIPERFRRNIIDFLIEVGAETRICRELKTEYRWSIDEFYRYSTAILAGFLDALNSKGEGDKNSSASEEEETELKEGEGVGDA